MVNSRCGVITPEESVPPKQSTNLVPATVVRVASVYQVYEQLYPLSQ